MNKHKRQYGFTAITYCIGVLLAAASCTAEVPPSFGPDEQATTIPVQVNVSPDEIQTRAPSDAALSVNRVLIIPFRKTDETLPDVPGNYAADYSAARQIPVTTFPAVATMLNLQSSSTYRLLILGYNFQDYDFANPSSASRRFDIGQTSNPATLENVFLKPLNVMGIPEFFSCQGTGYMNGTAIGTSFRPDQINSVSGTLVRIVSGLTLVLNQIPDYVKSVTLVAEQLVTATRATDGTALQWQTTGDGASRTLAVRIPVAGNVTFDQFVLAIPDAQKTSLYLDIAYGQFVERHTVIVTDTPNVASGNRITFKPNEWVKLTGSYATINLGFTLANNVNLDDDAWDGIQ